MHYGKLLASVGVVTLGAPTLLLESALLICPDLMNRLLAQGILLTGGALAS